MAVAAAAQGIKDCEDYEPPSSKLSEVLEDLGSPEPGSGLERSTEVLAFVATTREG